MVASRVASCTRDSGGVAALSFVASAVRARRSDLEMAGRSARPAARAAPSERSSSTSTPASNRIARSRAKPPHTSRMPTTAKLQAPRRRGLIQAPKPSWGSASIGTSTMPGGGASGASGLAPGQCQTQASRGSCPSAKARAETRNGNPRVAFAGNAPPSTLGLTCSTTTRLRSPSSRSGTGLLIEFICDARSVTS